MIRRVITAEVTKNLKQRFFSGRTFFWTLVNPLANGLYLYFLYLPFGVGQVSTSFLGSQFSVGLVGFTIVGQLLYTFFTEVALTGTTFDLERQQGTLEAMFLTPANRFALILGNVVYGSLSYLWMLGGVLISWVLFLRIQPTVADPLALLLSLFLSYLSLVAVATCISAFFIHSRRGVMYGTMVQEPTMFFSGLIFPMQSMPSFLLPLSFLIPLTFGLICVRSTLLAGGNLESISFPLFALATMTAGFFILGKWLIGYVEKLAKVKATLAQF